MSKYTPVKLAYKIYEPTSGKIDEKLSPVIFLHCATGSKEMWNDVAQIITNKTKRKTYAVDARNHGDSEWSDTFNLDLNVEDLFHFMDTMSIGKAVLVGHSMGGITTIRAALKEPERIEMVFVEDMYVRKFNSTDLEMLLNYIDIIRDAVEHIPIDCAEKDAAGYFTRYLLESGSEKHKSFFSSEMLEKIECPLKRDTEGRYLSKANLNVIRKGLENLDSLISEPEGLYEGPAYFIYGCKSPFLVHKEEEHIRNFFPRAELIGIEDAEHSIHAKFAEKFTEILLKNI